MTQRSPLEEDGAKDKSCYQGIMLEELGLQAGDCKGNTIEATDKHLDAEITDLRVAELRQLAKGTCRLTAVAMRTIRKPES